MSTQNSNNTTYKFGDSDLNLKDYIHNLETNYLSYVNSLNLSLSLKDVFRASYDLYLEGLQLQLDNPNSARFSTKSDGSIIDLTGRLGNIDQVLFYFDNKGNRITAGDWELLNKRDKKKYTLFEANKEVATYLNEVGKALRDAVGLKLVARTPETNKFDLTKHGFLADWVTTNNPAGGDFNYDPYLGRDDVDEKTGKRGTANRAAYLKKLIENYINNIGEYDFSSSPFKDRDTYILRLNEAALSLENGYNLEDVIALNRAGIGKDFLDKFFATGAEEAPVQKSELELQAELAALKLEERKKLDLLRAVITTEGEDKYNRERDTFFSNYAREHLFLSRGPSTPLPLSYTRLAVEKAAIKRFNADPNNPEAVKEAIRKYINIPLLSKLIRGKINLILKDDSTDITALHITNNLDLAALANLFLDPRYLNELGNSILPDNYYVLPGSEDYDNWTYIAYNPFTRQYQELSMLLNDELKKRMAYPEYDKRNKKSNEAQKHLLGGTLKDIESRQNLALEEKLKVELKSYTTGRTRELIESDLDPHTEWSKADRLRLGAIAGDISSLIASMTGVGSVASAGIGMASTAANLAADMTEGMGFLESLGNNAVSYGLDVLSLIPFARAAKVPKTIKAIAGFAPKLMAIISTAQGISNAPEITKSLSKLNSSESLTVEDWRNIANGILIVLGGTAATHRASKAKSHVDAARTNDEWLKTEQGYRRISEQDMKKLREATTIKELNNILSPYNVTLAESRGRFGLGKGKGKADITSENYYYDFDKPVTTYSGDIPILYTFGPVEKWLGTRTIPSLRIPAVRNVYNRVMHPQAYNRAKGKVTSKANKKSQQQSNFDRLKQLSSQTGELTPQEIAIINKLRVKLGKEKLTKLEIDALNQRRLNRADDSTNNSFQARLLRYKEGKRKGKSTSVEEDVKRAKDELAEATRLQRLAVPTGLGEFVAPNANLVRFVMGFPSSIPTINPSRPPISNPPAIIPKLLIKIEQPQLFPFNYDRIREGLARAERERLGKDIGELRLLRAIETNPERSARLQSEEAYRNVRLAFNLYGVPLYKRSLTGSAYKAKLDMYNRLFNQRRYDIIEAFRNRELPHKLSTKKKKTSRDDRRTVRREYGGTLNLSKVRKFLSGSSITGIKDKPEQPKLNSKINFLLDLGNNPTILYGLPRAVFADLFNKKITDKTFLKPLLLEPFEFNRYVRSDLDAEALAWKEYALLRSLAQRPLTSDGALLEAMLLLATLEGLKRFEEGKAKSNEVQRQYNELSLQLQKENALNVHNTAMANREKILDIDKIKSAVELAYLSKKHNIWDTLWLLLEFDEKSKIQENKTLRDRFAASQIHDIVSKNLGKYAPELSPESVNLYYLVANGSIAPSELSKDPAKWQLFLKAQNAASKAELELQRQYFDIPKLDFGDDTSENTWNAAITFANKKGGKLDKSEKIYKANLKAKIEDTKRFNKNVKDSIDRNEKALTRLYKSTKKKK